MNLTPKFKQPNLKKCDEEWNHIVQFVIVQEGEGLKGWDREAICGGR